MQIFKEIHDINLRVSSFVGTKIYSNNNQYLGKLEDFFVNFHEIFPTIIAIKTKFKRKIRNYSWQDIQSFNNKRIILKPNIQFQEGNSFKEFLTEDNKSQSILKNLRQQNIEYFPLCKIILDRQIVDTSGKKVVRVNDIELMRSGRELKVTNAMIGLDSLLSRLGISYIAPFFNFLFSKFPKYNFNNKINWKYVHAIPTKNVQSHIELKLSNEDLKKMHPADIADILEDIDIYGRNIIFKNLGNKVAAETLSEIDDDDIKTNLIKHESSDMVAAIISEMDSDDATDILNELSTSRQDEIIANIKDDETQIELQELLEYKEDCAGGIMTTDFLSVPDNFTKLDIIKLLHKDIEEYDLIDTIYVLNQQENLLGIILIKDILLKADNIEVKEYMITKDIIQTTADTNWKEVAQIMNKYNLITMPVVSDTNEMLGMLSIDDILSWALND